MTLSHHDTYEAQNGICQGANTLSTDTCSTVLCQKQRGGCHSTRLLGLFACVGEGINVTTTPCRACLE